MLAQKQLDATKQQLEASSKNDKNGKAKLFTNVDYYFDIISVMMCSYEKFWSSKFNSNKNC
ncbi:hypothetical protein RhiirA5_432192 [Rhizophagus irregularis]|uniref:Uncharacterized protein n=1 Tax=Rhizophagus irregularis TaxID=588596 RepID=A0A2I1F0V7_9GLOM|nr:hypothetical protein RhiirA5_432192 [Rhizophagus irregularis]PKC54774.1 hypothetical protein RhiirA1_476689 [Rhizophagus irregularis]PKY28006.1 hypothetical protein RhiirB3_443966 [Rhizophagus irregularis]GET51344.1 hypothetical protein RIR_e73011_A0A2I1F0V7_9GLOM [Rhizophagus irregularis DAOM 181602=DAOM 197198]